jgi:HSP20 family protein
MKHEIQKWEPFRELSGFQDEMNHLFEDFFGRVPARRMFSEGFWAPLMDIEETKDEILVKAELPGMRKEEVKIQINNDVLSITGERKREEETREKTYHRIERAYGKFQRMIRLPTEVDANNVKATYENGVLTIRLPKSEQAKPKEIAIEVK